MTRDYEDLFAAVCGVLVAVLFACAVIGLAMVAR